MEDALGEFGLESEVQWEMGLNPCCNGRCSRSKRLLQVYSQRLSVLILVVMEDALGVLFFKDRVYNRVLILVVMEDALRDKYQMLSIMEQIKVLILVVMEDALGDHEKVISTRNYRWVLILVVMEDALGDRTRKHLNLLTCLNPCCNGRCSRRVLCQKNCKRDSSLNPCCNGRCSRRIYGKVFKYTFKVLILVVMEDALGGKRITI